ncbi:MAG: hypothetical protein NZ530_01750 [Thermodesulfobacteriaceae bacterium]|nr:hypothetical protein [Thermodesulfobacteriaceae bacterium]MCX8041371.1 hypothetical protein [Thermodesulfobacteriaceae bacterium]MDW8135868.1 hypothetical protein [Thermodesulfobacterium sp.]
MDEFDELGSEFRVDDNGLEAMRDEEVEKREMISAREFHKNNSRLIGVKDREEISKFLKVLGKVVGENDLRGFLNFKPNQLIGSLRIDSFWSFIA